MVSRPVVALHRTGFGCDSLVQSTTLVSPEKHASRTEAEPCASAIFPAHNASWMRTLAAPNTVRADLALSHPTAINRIRERISHRFMRWPHLIRAYAIT